MNLCPLQLYLSQKQQKTAGKLWIMKGILTTIKIRNKIYNKLDRARNETIKNQLYKFNLKNITT